MMRDLYTHYTLVTATYMLEPWEKVVFNSIVLVSISTVSYYVYTHILPLVY